MERLQSAIQKARGSRQESEASAARSRPLTSLRAQAGTSLAAWEALAQAAPATGASRRIAAITETGVDAAPFDLLRTRLLQIAEPKGWKRIGIVSAQAGAGKTTVTANLAYALSRQSDLRTIGLDFDLRRPMLARALRVTPPEDGMVALLRGEVPFESMACRLTPNLAFALNAKPATGTAELLQSSRTTEMLEMLERVYHPSFILIDLPPVYGSDDTLGFLRQCDAALIVVEAEKTPVKQIDVIEQQVAELTNVLGIVLNKCHFVDQTYGSQYGYY